MVCVEGCGEDNEKVEVDNIVDFDGSCSEGLRLVIVNGHLYHFIME